MAALRKRRWKTKDVSPAATRPATRPISAVRVWLASNIAMPTPATTSAGRRAMAPESHRTSDMPAASAAYSATCGAGMGHSALTSRP